MVVVALSATEDGFTKHVGGSFTGKGETLHAKLTEPVKLFILETVRVDDPDLPAAAMSTLAGFGDRLKPGGRAATAAFTADSASRSPKPSMLFGTGSDTPGSGTAVEVRKFRKFARCVAGSLTAKPDEACKTSAATAAA